jgi:hypothetical protein
MRDETKRASNRLHRRIENLKALELHRKKARRKKDPDVPKDHRGR